MKMTLEQRKLIMIRIIEVYGSRKAMSVETKISVQQISAVCTGKKPLTPIMAHYLGLRVTRVITYNIDRLSD